MEDLELLFKGPYVLAEAPSVRDAHDDFADSLAMAIVLTKDEAQTSVVEVTSNPFFSRRPRHLGR
jgi:hypothetical protein